MTSGTDASGAKAATTPPAQGSSDATPPAANSSGDVLAPPPIASTDDDAGPRSTPPPAALAVEHGTETSAQQVSELASPAGVDVATSGEAPPPPAATAAAAVEAVPAAPATEATETVILPPAHWVHAAAEAADDDEQDADSALGEVQSSTASVTSSILRYRSIHGRTFHSEQGDAHYWGANDERQSEAMDINHHTQTLGLGDKLFLAPLKDDIQKAVDIGTGTGIWAIDFADAFPNTQVIGTDISPIQPTWVPPNLEFQIDDCTRPWTFADNSLDYVHVRFLAGSIANWPALFAEAHRCLRPGGILESMEPSACIESDDGSVAEDSAMAQWGRVFIEGGRRAGRSFTVYQDELQNRAMEQAGFVDLHESKFKSPIGSWPKDTRLREIGQYAQLVMEQDFEGLILFMANVLNGWTKEQILVYIAQLRREIRNPRIHGWYWQKVVWARKLGGNS